jgi:hypothetical protein
MVGSMTTVFENDVIRVAETGRDYDFIATVENKTAEEIAVTVPIGDEHIDDAAEIFKIAPGGWVGILADSEGQATLDKLIDNNFEIRKV